MIGKMILKGKIELISPLKIGSHKGDNTDNDVLIDKDGIPYIPATAFIGVLRHYLKIDDKSYLDKIFGKEREDESKDDNTSRIYCSDLRTNLKENLIEIRDGIEIDSKTGIVKKGAKFNYEIVKKGVEFSFFIELNVYEKDKDESFISTIVDILQNGKINLGSKTNTGFGKIKLKEYKYIYLDFNNKLDVLKWIKKDFSNSVEIKANPLIIDDKTFTINATFSLKNSLLIKSYTSDPKMPDSVHLTSDGKNIISGSSIKGAVRSRARRIINTLGLREIIFEELFGDVDLKNKKRAKKGKVQVQEVEIPKFISEMQTRIKINRFTGGTIDGALFESMPIFTDFKEKVKDVKITLSGYKDYEIGILLLVLKDLWSGDISIGGDKGIGRGVFQGENAEISWGNKSIQLDNDLNKLSTDEKLLLESFVNDLVKQGVTV